MAMFDFLKGDSGINNLPSYDVATTPINSGGGMLDIITNALKNPNVIRTMGDVGAKMSGPGTIGEAVGTGASNLVRNEQLQKAGEKQGKLNQMVIDALTGKSDVTKLVGPKCDVNTADEIVLKGDGSYTLKGGLRAPGSNAVGYQEEKPLESLNRGGDVPFL
jgi:hypothetical protein